MRLPVTLSFYIGRQFFFAIIAVIAVMMLLAGLVELLELVRRAGNAPRGVPFLTILEMSWLKLPTTLEKVYPFAFLIGGMVTLSRLTRTNELVVARSAGVSVWQFLLPGVALALLMGMFMVCIMNPIAAATILRYDRIEGKYITNQPSTLSISPSGLWLRQVDETALSFNGTPINEYILHATRMDQTTLAWQQVIIFFFADKGGFVGRIDANSAVLSPGKWTVANAVLSTPGGTPQPVPVFTMPTQLTIDQIEDSFAAPETFSFWQLPGFIQVLQKAGFSAVRHKLHFHSLVALPVLLAGMLMMAAVFTLSQPRRGKSGMLIVGGVTAGFLFYFATNLIYALGASGHLPIALAAWAPSLLVVMFSSAALLHLEDG